MCTRHKGKAAHLLLTSKRAKGLAWNSNSIGLCLAGWLACWMSVCRQMGELGIGPFGCSFAHKRRQIASPIVPLEPIERGQKGTTLQPEIGRHFACLPELNVAQRAAAFWRFAALEAKASGQARSEISPNTLGLDARVCQLAIVVANSSAASLTPAHREDPRLPQGQLHATQAKLRLTIDTGAPRKGAKKMKE